MFCSACGAQLAKIDRFCGSCGTPIEPRPAPIAGPGTNEAPEGQASGHTGGAKIAAASVGAAVLIILILVGIWSRRDAGLAARVQHEIEVNPNLSSQELVVKLVEEEDGYVLLSVGGVQWGNGPGWDAKNGIRSGTETFAMTTLYWGSQQAQTLANLEQVLSKLEGIKQIKWQIPDTESRDPVPFAHPSVESLIQADPGNSELWTRALMEWQTTNTRDGGAILGAMGMSLLVRGQRAPVDDESIVSALRLVGPLPIAFYVSLARTAAATNGRTTALAIVSEGIRILPNEPSLLRLRSEFDR